MQPQRDPHTPIDTHTKLVGLLGLPLGHSLSPAMHNRAFQTLGLNYTYLPIEVSDRDLRTVAAGIARMNFIGYNVTIPHKIRIMDSLDAIDPLAQAIGAVNTVTIENGCSTGYNTDGIGFLKSLEAVGEGALADKSVVVLGSGGAARAIVMTLAQEGAGRITISNRTEKKARLLAKDANRRGRSCCEALALQPAPLKAALQEAHILVNTTSVGMHPDTAQTPIDARLLEDHLVVCDIVYNPRRTRLLDAARQKGCRIVEGLGMLVYQGAASFRLWTGLAPPIAAMFAAFEP
jgi:shikimate dehydrogenase